MYVAQIYDNTQGHIPEVRSFVTTVGKLIRTSLSDIATLTYDTDDDDSLYRHLTVELGLRVPHPPTMPP
jgi:hypothetical protein